MLDYLREKRDVGFFQSIAGLMLSCRWVNVEKFNEKSRQMSQSLVYSAESFFVCVFLLSSVLDLNAFERKNKAEGLGMAMDESSGTVFIWK